MALGRVLRAAGWALSLSPLLAYSSASPAQAGAGSTGPDSAPAPMELGAKQIPRENFEWLVRPLELGRSVPIAQLDTLDGGGLQARVLQGIRLSAVALPEGVEVVAFAATLTWPGGGMGGGSVLGASAFVLPAGAVEPAPPRINMVLHARLEAAEGAAEVDLEGPVQWLLEVGAEPDGVQKYLSGAAGRLAVPLLSGGDSEEGEPRGGGKLAATAMAGGSVEGTNVLLAVIPAGLAAGAATVARSEDGGHTWNIGPLSLEGQGAPWAEAIERPALLWDPRDRAFRLMCHLAAPVAVPGAVPPPGPSGEAPAGAVLVELVSRDLGKTWSAPEAVQLSQPEAGRTDPQLRLSASGGRGVAASSGESLWPVEIRGPGGGVRYGLLRAARDGRRSLTAMAPRGRYQACFVELGDGAILASAASIRHPGREFRLWREIDAAWRSPVREPEPYLPCAGGAAAIIHVGREIFGAMDGRLVTANAAVRRKPPSRMAIRGSNDGGVRWPENREVVLDDGKAVGAPGLAVIDRDSVGIIYRASSGSVVFQALPLAEVVDPVGGIGSVLRDR